MPSGNILLADDEEKILKTLGRALREDGHDVVTTPHAADVQRLLSERPFDLLVIDYLMPERTGLDVIRDLVGSTPEGDRPAIVMMTAHGTVESAVEAMKLGARDYLQKPFDVEELLVTVRRLLEEQRTRTGLRYLLSERDAEFNHYARSAQRDMPLIKVNCAAIPETLLESELFGHVRGAFTGATFTKKGRFALADGGTIFLDEIATISTAVQAKLLRVLQDREFEPLGSERTQKVDVRVIAATNRDLRQLVSSGKFQEDLYYRLNVIPITIPPLRERREDIAMLVDHFLRRYAQNSGKRIEGVDTGLMAELERYEWPGNVRELENTIERAVVLATGPRLTRETVWLMGAVTPPAGGLPSQKLHANLEWAEKETIRKALAQAGGVKKDAAELMGISQRALSHYLQKYKFEKSSETT
jgi:two-component system NtrC family response regulator